MDRVGPGASVPPRYTGFAPHPPLAFFHPRFYVRRPTPLAFAFFLLSANAPEAALCGALGSSDSQLGPIGYFGFTFRGSRQWIVVAGNLTMPRRMVTSPRGKAREIGGTWGKMEIGGVDRSRRWLSERTGGNQGWMVEGGRTARPG
ncbi:hypothetical protein KM043_006517 [Ampulex compressa]|nr:hypothetical protein KM043_006517 [Ampulex compressa]